MHFCRGECGGRTNAKQSSQGLLETGTSRFTEAKVVTIQFPERHFSRARALNPAHALLILSHSKDCVRLEHFVFDKKPFLLQWFTSTTCLNVIFHAPLGQSNGPHRCHPRLRPGLRQLPCIFTMSKRTEIRCHSLGGPSRIQCFVTELPWRITHTTSRQKLREFEIRHIGFSHGINNAKDCTTNAWQRLSKTIEPFLAVNKQDSEKDKRLRELKNMTMQSTLAQAGGSIKSQEETRQLRPRRQMVIDTIAKRAVGIPSVLHGVTIREKKSQS